MSWATFWIVFFFASLSTYALVALYVSVRGGVELADLIRKMRVSQPAPTVVVSKPSDGEAGEGGP
jgi:hypothetical protein